MRCAPTSTLTGSDRNHLSRTSDMTTEGIEAVLLRDQGDDRPGPRRAYLESPGSGQEVTARHPTCSRTRSACNWRPRTTAGGLARTWTRPARRPGLEAAAADRARLRHPPLAAAGAGRLRGERVLVADSRRPSKAHAHPERRSSASTPHRKCWPWPTKPVSRINADDGFGALTGPRPNQTLSPMVGRGPGSGIALTSAGIGRARDRRQQRKDGVCE
jgi:hypothetical protein